MGQRLGQHFLYDQDILDQIINSADLTSEDTVLEVGPGKGDLTAKLAEVASKVTAVEFDSVLAKSLENSRLPSNVTVIEQDILDFDLTCLDDGYKVIANIPYYLTSKLIQRMLEAQNRPSRLVLLIQKEVAERLAAGPGKMSILAISAQLYGDVSLGVKVDAEFFDPPPKVDSQVVVIDVLPEPTLQVDNKKFFRLVKAGFSGKRKKLKNALAGSLSVDGGIVEGVISELGLKEGVRAQQLSMGEWGELYNLMVKKELL